jgi:hypothetical protein
MDQRTNYAEPPPGRLERIGNGLEAFKKWNDRVGREFLIGIGVGAWEMVKGVGMLAFYLNPAMLPVTGPKLWENRDNVKAIATFAWDNPGLFAKEMGKAVVDWETLDESPARWLGKMVPDLLLSLATIGTGKAASTGAKATIKALEKTGDLADKSQALSRAGRVTDGRPLATTARTALHESVSFMEKKIQPGNAKVEGRLQPLLAEVDVKPPGMHTTVKEYLLDHERTLVTDAVTAGSYSRLREADRWVNGMPGMKWRDRARFAAPRALSNGSTFADRQAIYVQADTLASTTEPAAPGGGSNPPPPAGPTPAPAPRPDVLDPAPATAPPPARYQTTSSASPP